MATRRLKRLGFNATAIGDSPEIPFLDLGKMARPWKWERSEGGDLEGLVLDAQGYPQSLPEGTLATSFIHMGIPGCYKAGRYVLRWSGPGKVTVVEFEGSTKILSVGVSFLTLNKIKADDQGFCVQIVGGTGRVSNLRILHESDMPLYEQKQIFNPDFIANTCGGPLRLMDWGATNLSKISGCANRPVPQRWSYQEGVPLEIMIRLCNETKQDGWFCIPHLASFDSEYLLWMAVTLAKTLNPQLKAYVEVSNEVWNFAGWGNDDGQTGHFFNKAMEKYGNGDMYRQVYLEVACCAASIFADVFKAQKRTNLRFVYGAQSAVWNTPGLLELKQQGELVRLFSGIGIAPYVGGDLGENDALPTVLEWAKMGAKGFDEAFRFLRGEKNIPGLFDPLGRSLPGILPELRWHRANADLLGLELYAYECGTHCAAVGDLQDNDELVTFLRQLNTKKQMGAFCSEYFNVLGEFLDGGYFHCSVSSPMDKSGFWGASARLKQCTPKTEAIKAFNQ